MKKFKMDTSTVLTGIGVVGVVSTAIFSAKATIKAIDLLKTCPVSEADLTKKDIFLTVAPCYIPTAISAVATISCILGANILNHKTQASMASAYALLNTTYQNYKTKVAEVCGPDAAEEVRAGLIQDQVPHLKFPDNADSKQLYYCDLSEVYFLAEEPNVLMAEAELNRLLAQNHTVYLSDWWDILDGYGCEPVDDEFGVYRRLYHSSTDPICGDIYASDVPWIDFDHYRVPIDESMVCTVISASVPNWEDE